MAMFVVWPWIGFVDLLWYPPGVVAHHDVDLTSLRMSFHILRPVHLGRLQEIRGLAYGSISTTQPKRKGS
jgi:hypothetical protein